MPCSDLFSSSSKVRIGVSVSCACTGMSWIHDTVSTTEILCDRHQLEASLEEQFSLFNNLFNIGYVTAHLWCTMRKTMRRPRESSHMSLNTFLLSAKRKESRTTGKNAEMCNNQPYAFVIFGEIATTQRILIKVSWFLFYQFVLDYQLRWQQISANYWKEWTTLCRVTVNLFRV